MRLNISKVMDTLYQYKDFLLWLAFAIAVVMVLLAINGCDTADAAYYKNLYVQQKQETANVQAARDSLQQSIIQLYVFTDSIVYAANQQHLYIVQLESTLASYDSLRDSQTTEMLFSIQEGIDSALARLKRGELAWP